MQKKKQIRKHSQTIPSVSQDTEWLEPLCHDNGRIKWSTHFGKLAVCYGWIWGYPGPSHSTVSCVPKKTRVCTEDMCKNLHNITSHKSLALETFQMLTDNRMDNELCHVYAVQHGPAMRKREPLWHRKVKVKSPSLWVGWVWLPLPSKTDMDKSRKQYLRNEGRQNRVHQCVVSFVQDSKPNLCCQMSDDGNFCESNDGQVSGVLSVICYLIWVLITQVCSLCEFHPRVPDGALFFSF